MENYILQVSWLMTAICFSIGGIIMAMVTGGAAMWVVVKMFYFLKVSIEKMQQHAESEIQSLKIERIR